MSQFCIAPWVHMYIHPTGKAQTCCVGLEPLGSTKNESIQEIANGDKIKSLRKDFMEGKIPLDNCQTCFNFEKNNIHSLRQALNELFQDEIDTLTSQTYPDGTFLNFKQKYYDLRFSNLCNFRCRSCNEEYSTSIAKETKKHKNTNQEVFVFPGKFESDIYDQIKDQIKFAKKIYFAGGEPLLQWEHWEILDNLLKNNVTDVQLFYNTNLSSLKFKDYYAIDYWKEFKNVLILASIDGQYQKAEYWRKGTIWKDIEDNISTIKENVPHVSLGTTTTIGWPNLYTALDFIDRCIDTNLISPKLININVLQFPNFYSLPTLPEPEKTIAKERIIKTLEKAQAFGDSLLVYNLKGLIDFLMSQDNSKNLNLFFKTTDFYDKIRDEGFFDIFPEHASINKYRK